MRSVTQRFKKPTNQRGRCSVRALRPRALLKERRALCRGVHPVREREVWQCQRRNHMRAVLWRALRLGLWGREQRRVPGMPRGSKERRGLCGVRLRLHRGGV